LIFEISAFMNFHKFFIQFNISFWNGFNIFITHLEFVALLNLESHFESTNDTNSFDNCFVLLLCPDVLDNLLNKIARRIRCEFHQLKQSVHLFFPNSYLVSTKSIHDLQQFQFLFGISSVYFLKLIIFLRYDSFWKNVSIYRHRVLRYPPLLAL
jgi:hypothetical protein